MNDGPTSSAPSTSSAPATPAAPSPAPSTTATPSTAQPATASTTVAPASPPSTSSTAQPAAAPTSTAARIKLRNGDAVEEIDESTYVTRLREAVGDEGLANIGQIARVVRAKMSQAGQTEREIRQAVDDLKDPGRFFEVLARVHGPDRARAMVEEWLGNDLVQRTKPKDVQERDSVKSELQRLRAERDQYVSEQRERQLTQLAERAQEGFKTKFSAALLAAGVDKADLEANPAMLAEMVGHVQPEWRDGMTPDEVALLLQDSARAVAHRWNDLPEQRFPKLPEVKRQALVVAHLKTMKPADVVAALGPEGMRALRAFDAAQVRERQADGRFAAPKPTVQPSNGSAPERRPVPVEEWLKPRW